MAAALFVAEYATTPMEQAISGLALISPGKLASRAGSERHGGLTARDLSRTRRGMTSILGWSGRRNVWNWHERDLGGRSGARGTFAAPSHDRARRIHEPGSTAAFVLSLRIFCV
jgi:hypothetical protein